MIFIIAAIAALSRPVHGQLEYLDKGHRALIEGGLQIHGQNLGPVLVLKDVLFDGFVGTRWRPRSS